MKRYREEQGRGLMNENVWFLVELFSFLFLLAGSMALTMTLTRRWYRKRNGQDRSQDYANDTHQKITMWFVLIIVFLLLPVMNLEQTPGHWIFLLITLPLFLLYLMIGTHLWKKVSNNKDDYWHDWWVSGGFFVWFMLFMIGRQWWGL